MTQTYDPSWHDRYHSEVDHNDGYARGDERFYGFMFRVSEQWEFVSQNLNIAQFIAHRPGSDNCSDLDMPSTMLWIAGHQLHSRLVQGPYLGGNCHRNFVDLPNLGEIKPGQWHKVIMQAKWEDNGSGYFKLWFDGEKVVEKYNLATTVSGDWKFQFRGMLYDRLSRSNLFFFPQLDFANDMPVGGYMNSWHDSGHMEGNQPFRQLWYDEVSVGTTYKDVDPDQN